jgi:hypothetical protein
VYYDAVRRERKNGKSGTKKKEKEIKEWHVLQVGTQKLMTHFISMEGFLI